MPLEDPLPEDRRLAIGPVGQAYPEASILRIRPGSRKSHKWEANSKGRTSCGLQVDHLTLMFDGAARGNPGPAGGGAVLYASSAEGARVKFWEGWEFFGYSHTNNEAEFLAIYLWTREIVRRFFGYPVLIG